MTKKGSQGLTPGFIARLVVLWIALSAVYVLVSRLGQSKLEPGVFVVIPVILVPIALARAARLTGKEKITLTRRSLTGTRGLLKDVVESIERGRRDDGPSGK